MKKKYILILLALLIISVYFYGLLSTTFKIEQTPVQTLNLEIRNGSILDFGNLVEGEWDRMCIITPYTSRDKAMKSTGLNVNRLKQYTIENQDTDNLLIFAKGNMVRKYFYVPRSLVDVESNKIKSGGYEREEAIFMVETKEKGAFLSHMDDMRMVNNSGRPETDKIFAVKAGDPEKIGGSDFTIRWLEKGYNKPNKAYRFSEGLMAIEKDGKWGYMDKTGRIVIPLMYDYAGEFSEGVAPVKLEQKYGGINWWNEIVIPMNYDYMGEFSEGRSLVIKKELRKNEVTDKFDYRNSSNRFIHGQLQEKHGFIDRKGNLIIPLIYDGAGSFSNGVVPLEKDGIWSVADEDGLILYATVYDHVGSFSKEGLAVVRNEFGTGYINMEGSLITSMNYDSAWDFSESLALVEEENGYHFINEKGNNALNPDYEYYGGDGKFSEGRAVVIKDRKFGYIDRYGSLDIPLIYDGAMDFSEGLAAICEHYNEDRWGYINKNNKMLVPAIFDETHPFSEGVALVRKGDNWGILYRPAENGS